MLKRLNGDGDVGKLLDAIKAACGYTIARLVAFELMAGYAAQANRWHLYYGVVDWLEDQIDVQAA